MSIRPAVMRRLMRELAQLKTDPPEGIRISSPEEDMLDVTGFIEGPAGTPYEGGYFKVKFSFTEEFPAAPPKCRMITKIFHPNVSTVGEICVNTLKKDWQASYGIAHILVTVKCLLIYPNPESALDEQAGKLLLENYESYCERARLVTSVHAKVRPAEFDVHAATSSTPSSSKTKMQDNKPASNAQSLTTSSPTFTRKSPSPAPAPQPLHPSVAASNTVSSLFTPEKESTTNKDSAKDKEKDGKEKATIPAPAPSPLGTVNANAPTPTSAAAGANGVGKDAGVGANGAVKAVKRPAAGATGAGGGQRKKALKRL